MQEGHKQVLKSNSKQLDKKKCIQLVELDDKKHDTVAVGDLQLVYGRESKPFKRFKVAKEIEQLSFSISTVITIDSKEKRSRELCLEASSQEEMFLFINNLNQILKFYHKNRQSRQIEETQKNEENEPHKNE